MKTFKELREASGMNKTQFAKYFGIPFRTVQDWELGNRKCNDYLLDLMEYKLKHEGLIRADMGTKVYLIYKDNQDDVCAFIGRFVGTEKEVDRYCDEYNSKCRYEYEEIFWLCVADMDDVNS
jgi:transcriptional regulator with XRE-family HTH domain